MKKNILHWAKKLLLITVAIALIAVCVNMFLGPHSIAAGGITGLAIIFEELFSLHRALTILISNAVILVATFFLLGKEVFFNTVIGASLLPLFVRVIPQMMLMEDVMLSMLAGSALFGVAVSILYRNRASSGGTAVPPLILQKYLKLNPAIGLFISDGVIVALSLFVFSLDSFFYAVFSILITSITMRSIEAGTNKKKMVYVISDHNPAITQDILTKINRGVTLVPVVGAYENAQKQMLMVTLDAKQYQDLLAIVNSHDESAFMVADTVTDVHGRGFSYESGSV